MEVEPVKVVFHDMGEIHPDVYKHVYQQRLFDIEQTLTEMFTLLREIANEVLWADQDDDYSDDLEDSDESPKKKPCLRRSSVNLK